MKLCKISLLVMLLCAMALPAAADDAHMGHMGHDWCCNIVPSTNPHDAELVKLWADINAGFADADHRISLELTHDQRMDYNASTDDLNWTWFKLHCLNVLEGKAYVAYLSERLHLSSGQESAVTHIEMDMVRKVMPLWMTYCEEYWKHLIIVRVAEVPVVAPPPPPPVETPRPAPPPPSRKINRTRGEKK